MSRHRLEPDAISGASPASSSPSSQPITILAFDFGEKNIGVAIGNTLTVTASPLALVSGASAQSRLEKIEILLRKWNPQRLVVGLPLSLDGNEQQISEHARRFARQLASRFRLPVDFADERLSSAAAEEQLRQFGRAGQRHKDLVHAEAARVILQAYLDEHYASRH